jgi:hypothetical protein
MPKGIEGINKEEEFDKYLTYLQPILSSSPSQKSDKTATPHPKNSCRPLSYSTLILGIRGCHIRVIQEIGQRIDLSIFHALLLSLSKFEKNWIFT